MFELVLAIPPWPPEVTEEPVPVDAVRTLPETAGPADTSVTVEPVVDDPPVASPQAVAHSTQRTPVAHLRQAPCNQPTRKC